MSPHEASVFARGFEVPESRIRGHHDGSSLPQMNQDLYRRFSDLSATFTVLVNDRQNSPP